jgi:release factor glutamine methyltransferase
LAGKILQPVVKKYLSRSRHYRWKNIRIVVKPGVFHPGLFFSTKVMLGYIEENLKLQNKTLLEPGAGSGLISIFAAKKGAFVTATDVSLTAIKNIRENAHKNLVNINVIHSDLFDNIDKDLHPDIIVINPPYYPENPVTEGELAWYCGKNFEYFKNLFRELPQHIHSKTTVLIVLSQDCKINTIKKIAELHGFKFKEVQRKKTWWEINYIFEITKQ